VHAVDPHAAYRAALEIIRRDLSAAEGEFAECRGRLLAIQKRAGELRKVEASLLELLGEGMPSEKAGRPNTNTAEWHAEAVERVMQRIGRPMRIPEIISELKHDGYIMPPTSSDFWVLASMMRRRTQKFERVARGLWALK
jgi:hypothetical protein